ncbi:hypothetical protein [Alcanivorax sediminis]|uniref:Uncharacterized protein n=1 Tax=Alcanivorax sediminis TaxID=2663008 RepID=A0A6N7LRK9_9GAMM|nr:hypothetical protein [Alcanivorax sediminis]MQX53038.1 hypothetical protein [Alcanivorax sediminis]
MMVRICCLIKLAVIPVLMAGCQEVDVEKSKHFQRHEIIDVISEANAQEVNPFVIVGDSENGIYIQYWVENDVVSYDRPLIGLTEEEVNLLVRVHERYGIQHREVISENVESDSPFYLRTFTHDFAVSEKESAVDLGLLVLKEGFSLSDETPLKIEMGWK